MKWFRGFIQGKTRITLAWVFVLLLGLSAQDYPAVPGVFVCFLGACLRFWASGYLRKDLRPAVGGPYRFIRNPLYLGTYLMAVGTAWATENWILLVGTSILFAVVYHFIILDEETKLRGIFNQYYDAYCESVPRFFPRVWPPLMPATEAQMSRVNPDEAHWQFSMDLAWANKAYEAFGSFGGMILFITVAAYIWKAVA